MILSVRGAMSSASEFSFTPYIVVLRTLRVNAINFDGNLKGQLGVFDLVNDKLYSIWRGFNLVNFSKFLSSHNTPWGENN